MSWADNARFVHELAHDLRQPLGDIEMIAYHLLQTCDAVERSRAREMLGRIRLLVEQANELLSRSVREAEDSREGITREPAGLSALPATPIGV